jgi:hypothetical protein
MEPVAEAAEQADIEMLQIREEFSGVWLPMANGQSHYTACCT